MRTLLWTMLLFSTYAHANCPADYKDVHNGANRLYQKCYCMQVVPPEAMVIADSLGMTVKSDTAWSEQVDGQAWYKCIIGFSFKDRTIKKTPECKTRKEQLAAKLKSERALSNYAWNYSFLGCN